MTSHDHTAEALRQQEFPRLSAATVPTLESLRFLNPRELRACVAGMLERLGYELLTAETAIMASNPDLPLIKSSLREFLSQIHSTESLGDWL